MNQSTTAKGNLYETKACEVYEESGYKIIQRNYHAKKLGEIDIIATKNHVYHFIEVKSGESFEAVYNITPSKLHKLYRSVEYYLKEKNLEVDYCVDAIIFYGDKYEILENISL
jgi:putative endonuclease